VCDILVVFIFSDVYKFVFYLFVFLDVDHVQGDIVGLFARHILY
jgi:hypothetical protein